MAAKKRSQTPAGCYWRGGTLWGRTRVGGQNVRWSLETDDPRVAAERYKAGKDRVIAQRHGDGVRRFDEVLVPWKIWLEQRVRPKTVIRYLASLAQIAPFLEGKTLAEIDVALVGTIIEARQQQHVNNATVKGDLVALSSVFIYAIGKGWTKFNPVQTHYDAETVRVKRDPIVLPSQTDIDLVISRAPGAIAGITRFAIATGARQDELVRATRDRIDHQRRQMTLIGKGNKMRVIDLEPFGGYALVLAQPASERTPLLFWHSDGESYKNFSTQFAAVVNRTAAWAKKHNVPFRKFRFHDLRHYHAVIWLKSGRQYRDLQHRLGHTSIVTTEGYWTYLTAEEDRVAKGYHSEAVATNSATVMWPQKSKDNISD
jgi:integrase/recombinase XerD